MIAPRVSLFRLGMSMTSLPFDVLEHIFRFVVSLRCINPFQCASKQLDRVANSPSAWAGLILQERASCACKSICLTWLASCSRECEGGSTRVTFPANSPKYMRWPTVPYIEQRYATRARQHDPDLLDGREHSHVLMQLPRARTLSFAAPLGCA